MKRRKGFTLIELLIVIAIIGVLIAMAVTRFASLATEKDERVCQANMRTTNSAIQIWSSQQSAGGFPTNLTTLEGLYLVKLPRCPTDNSSYTSSSSGDYAVCAYTTPHVLPGF